MNIIFLGTTGIHHTLIAAHLYLGKLEQEGYANLKFWDDRNKEVLGYPIFIDYDKKRNKIYSLGGGWEVLMTQKTIEQLVKIMDFSEQDLVVKPIFIKRERILLLLYKIGRFKIVNRLVLPVINYLIKKEFTAIKQQVEEFKGGVRFA